MGEKEKSMLLINRQELYLAIRAKWLLEEMETELIRKKRTKIDRERLGDALSNYESSAIICEVTVNFLRRIRGESDEDAKGLENYMGEIRRMVRLVCRNLGSGKSKQVIKTQIQGLENEMCEKGDVKAAEAKLASVSEPASWSSRSNLRRAEQRNAQRGVAERICGAECSVTP